MLKLCSISHTIALYPSLCTQAPYLISLLDVINSAYKCNAAATERMSCEQPSVEMVDCSDIVKLLHRAAKLIKSEITNCRGISIGPPSVVDLSLTKAKSLIPDSLYWSLRWIIAKAEKEGDDDFSSP